jgi:hypothetical protein
MLSCDNLSHSHDNIDTPADIADRGIVYVIFMLSINTVNQCTGPFKCYFQAGYPGPRVLVKSFTWGAIRVKQVVVQAVQNE